MNKGPDMRVIWILVTVAWTLLAPPAASRAAAGADAAAWPPQPIRAQASATRRPDAALSARVPEWASGGAESGDYRRPALDARRVANHPTGADVREFDAPIGVPARVAGIFRGDGEPGASLEGSATALEAAWPVGGLSGDGVSWKMAVLRLGDERRLGIKIKNLQLGMSIQQFLSKAHENFPIIVDSDKRVDAYIHPTIKVYYLVTKIYADELKNLEQMSSTNFRRELDLYNKISTARFYNDKLEHLVIIGDSFIDLFNTMNMPAMNFLKNFADTYDLDLMREEISPEVVRYNQNSDLWNFSALVANNKVISIEISLTDYGRMFLGQRTFD
jgi:hypothetical protein